MICFITLKTLGLFLQNIKFDYDYFGDLFRVAGSPFEMSSRIMVKNEVAQFGPLYFSNFLQSTQCRMDVKTLRWPVMYLVL